MGLLTKRATRELRLYFTGNYSMNVGSCHTVKLVSNALFRKQEPQLAPVLRVRVKSLVLWARHPLVSSDSPHDVSSTLTSDVAQQASCRWLLFRATRTKRVRCLFRLKTMVENIFLSSLQPLQQYCTTGPLMTIRGVDLGYI